MLRGIDQENINHKYLPYLVEKINFEGQSYIITSYLYDGCFFVLSDFVFPTIDMVLQKCKIDAKRTPNSFIIFRMFFNQSIKYIPSYNVGKISKIAKSVWKVVSDDIREAFLSLEKQVKMSLRKIRAPAFIMHGDNRNRKIRRFSPYGSSSSFDNEESAPSLDDNNISTIPGNYLPFYMPEFGIEAPNNLLGSEQDSLNFSMINDCLQLWGPNYYETNQYHNLIMTNEEIAETLLSETENNQPLQVHQQVEISSDITEFYS